LPQPPPVMGPAPMGPVPSNPGIANTSSKKVGRSVYAAGMASVMPGHNRTPSHTAVPCSCYPEPGPVYGSKYPVIGCERALTVSPRRIISSLAGGSAAASSKASPLPLTPAGAEPASVTDPRILKTGCHARTRTGLRRIAGTLPPSCHGAHTIRACSIKSWHIAHLLSFKMHRLFPCGVVLSPWAACQNDRPLF
jgi:hypothetical protein